MPKFCDYKNAYSKKTADFILRKQKERYPNKKFRVYECPVCSKWHITHKTNWIRKDTKEFMKHHGPNN